MSEKFVSPNAEIGETVLWYPNADMNYRPAPAIVVDTDGRGCLELAVIAPMATMIRTISGARHMSDPYHKISPDVSVDCGGWEGVEERLGRLYGFPETTEECDEGVRNGETREQAAERKRANGRFVGPSDDEILKVLELHYEGLSYEEIAKQMGDGWNYSRAYNTIKKHGKALTT